MPSGRYAKTSQRRLDKSFRRRFHHRPWLAPHMHFVAYRAVGHELAPLSRHEYRIWLIEGYGSTLDEAFTSLRLNVDRFMSGEHVPYLNPEE